MESPEVDQKLGLLSEEKAYDRTHNTFAQRGLDSPRKEHKSRPLWNLLKSALTVFWVGVLVYGLVRLFNGTLMPSSLAKQALTLTLIREANGNRILAFASAVSDMYHAGMHSCRFGNSL